MGFEFLIRAKMGDEFPRRHEVTYATRASRCPACRLEAAAQKRRRNAQLSRGEKAMR